MLVRKRNLARADRVKRRVTAASLLGFAALFGLAAQHVVRGATASARQTASTSRQASSAPTAYFDQSDAGFSFGDPAVQAQPAVDTAPQPMAQSSVS
jgi:hypothetical protein